MAWIYSAVVESATIGILMTMLMGVAAFLFHPWQATWPVWSGVPATPCRADDCDYHVGVSLAGIAHGITASRCTSGRTGDRAVVCCAAAMGGDNLQELKTGHLVGATSWKQQLMQVVGVLTGALVLVPLLSLLDAKYGLGEATSSRPHTLSAPQATLMANLTRSVFGGGVPWPLAGLGAAIGTLIILADRRQERLGSTVRFPVLAVALGIYLPLKLSAAIFVGGVISRMVKKNATQGTEPSQRGILFAAGLITGEALMGILLAIPIALTTMWPGLGADPFAIGTSPPLGGWPGLTIMILVGTLLSWVAVGSFSRLGTSVSNSSS